MVKTHLKSHTKEQTQPQQLSIKPNESSNSSKMTQILNTRLVDVANNSESWVESKDDGKVSLNTLLLLSAHQKILVYFNILNSI